jgi:hypothetical protein
MVLLRSIPELSTIYSNAIDFLGDAMNCKGSSSLLDTINCIDSSAWCDSRDEQEEIVVESSSLSSSSLSLSNKFANNNNNSNNNTDRGFEEDLSSRSLSSSVHQLLYDSSERQRSQHTKTDSMTMPMLVKQSEDDTIFRSRVEESTLQEESSNNNNNNNSSQCLQFYKLNRCTAWSQDDVGCYSFESEREQHHHHSTTTAAAAAAAEEPKKRSNVRMVHWDEIVHDSLNTNTNTNTNTNNEDNNTNIFRADSHCFNSLCKLDRCAAWSIDESSSSMVDGRLRSNSIQEQQLSSQSHQQQGDNNNNNNNNNEAKLVHWDELADKCLITHTN